MNGILIISALILLLVVALQPAQRRAGTRWRPGLDTRNDRDQARLGDELRAADQREPVAPRSKPVRLFSPGPAQASTGSDMVTRTAA